MANTQNLVNFPLIGDVKNGFSFTPVHRFLDISIFEYQAKVVLML